MFSLPHYKMIPQVLVPIPGTGTGTGTWLLRFSLDPTSYRPRLHTTTVSALVCCLSFIPAPATMMGYSLLAWRPSTIHLLGEVNRHHVTSGPLASRCFSLLGNPCEFNLVDSFVLCASVKRPCVVLVIE